MAEFIAPGPPPSRRGCHPLPPAHDRGRVHRRHPPGAVPEGRARGVAPPHGGGHARDRPLPAPRPPGPALVDPGRPRGLGQRPLRGPRPAPQRQHRGRRGAPVVPGHRHGDREGQEGPVRHDRRRRRGRHRPGHLRHLPDLEPALLPDGAARHVPRAEHRHQPPGRDRDRRRRRLGLQAAVHGQGWRLGQQELPLPGDQGAAQPPEPPRLRGSQDGPPGHLGLPAVPPGPRDRRHVGRVRPEDGQAGLGPLPRHAARRPATTWGGDSATSISSSRS